MWTRGFSPPLYPLWVCPVPLKLAIPTDFSVVFVPLLTWFLPSDHGPHFSTVWLMMIAPGCFPRLQDASNICQLGALVQAF
jgi:hypothetical protein